MVDVLDNLKTILNDNWNSSNTDNMTPEINIITDVKQIDAANGDHILLYEMIEPIEPFGIGAQEWAHDRQVSIDIRTTYKRASIPDIRPHLIKIKDEALRIIKSKVDNPDADHHLLVPLRKKDLSDKSIGIGRMVIDVSLKYWGV